MTNFKGPQRINCFANIQFILFCRFCASTTSTSTFYFENIEIGVLRRQHRHRRFTSTTTSTFYVGYNDIKVLCRQHRDRRFTSTTSRSTFYIDNIEIGVLRRQQHRILRRQRRHRRFEMGQTESTMEERPAVSFVTGGVKPRQETDKDPAVCVKRWFPSLQQ